MYLHREITRVLHVPVGLALLGIRLHAPMYVHSKEYAICLWASFVCKARPTAMHAGMADVSSVIKATPR